MEVPKGYGRQNWAKVNAIDFVKPKNNEFLFSEEEKYNYLSLRDSRGESKE